MLTYRMSYTKFGMQEAGSGQRGPKGLDGISVSNVTYTDTPSQFNFHFSNGHVVSIDFPAELDFNVINLTSGTANTVPVLSNTKQLVSSIITTTELNYLTGVNANVQATIDAIKAKFGTINNSMALVSDGTGKIISHANVSATELGYLNGATSNIQTQINSIVGGGGGGGGDNPVPDNLVPNAIVFAVATDEIGTNEALKWNPDDEQFEITQPVVVDARITANSIVAGKDGTSASIIITNTDGDTIFYSGGVEETTTLRGADSYEKMKVVHDNGNNLLVCNTIDHIVQVGGTGEVCYLNVNNSSNVSIFKAGGSEQNAILSGTNNVQKFAVKDESGNVAFAVNTNNGYVYGYGMPTITLGAYQGTSVNSIPIALAGDDIICYEVVLKCIVPATNGATLQMNFYDQNGTLINNSSAWNLFSVYDTSTGAFNGYGQTSVELGKNISNNANYGVCGCITLFPKTDSPYWQFKAETTYAGSYNLNNNIIGGYTIANDGGGRNVSSIELKFSAGAVACYNVSVIGKTLNHALL